MKSLIFFTVYNESLVSDIPAGYGKIVTFFTVYKTQPKTFHTDRTASPLFTWPYLTRLDSTWHLWIGVFKVPSSMTQPYSTWLGGGVPFVRNSLRSDTLFKQANSCRKFRQQVAFKTQKSLPIYDFHFLCQEGSRWRWEGRLSRPPGAQLAASFGPLLPALSGGPVFDRGEGLARLGSWV
jgi:hypothetical protein